VPKLVSRAELSRIAKVSDVAISKACKKALAPACVGTRVDLDHPAVAAYLERRAPPAEPTPAPKAASKGAARPTATRPKPPKQASVPPPSRPGPDREQPPQRIASAPPPRHPRPPEHIEDIEAYGHMSLHEITQRFGSMTAHADWLDMRKTQVDIREKEIKTGVLEGKLVPRDWVMTHVFGALERAFKQLLQDAPKTIARRIYGMAKAGASTEEAEKVLREIISSNLRPAKESAARAARHKESGPDGVVRAE
jgi:hypothetical protein